MHRLLPFKLPTFILLLTLSGCGRADISEARKNYILANDHSWVELSVEIAAPLVRATEQSCLLETTVNGERFLVEPLFPSGAAEKTIETGFLFSAPAARSEIALNYSQCQAQPVQAAVSVELPLDTLTRLRFDGKTISATAPVAYKPTALADIISNVERLDSSQNANQAMVANELALMFKLLVTIAIFMALALILGVLKYVKKQA